MNCSLGWPLRAALLLLGCLSLQCALADEDDPGRQEYWLGAGVSGPIGKRLDWQFDQALRLDKDFKVIGVIPQLGLSWSPVGWLELGTAYRLMHERDSAGDYQNRHRAQADANFGWRPFDDWKLSYRLRWQGEWRKPEDEGSPRRFFLRNRLQVKYQGFGWGAPYVSAETYHRVDNGQKTTGVEKTRYTLGSSFKLGKRQGLDLFGRKQAYFDDTPTAYLIGLEYSYALK